MFCNIVREQDKTTSKMQSIVKILRYYWLSRKLRTEIEKYIPAKIVSSDFI